ncbi:MAG: Si-specific NAD(P)(+) transhydrogenase [Gammaproteobacteria bacterium]|nr:Si-specific NAD(P)(+) transhydrogenase [Gammaproteobacteria bacterium]
MQRYDMLVIGSGPAGQRAAVQAAKLGKRTAIIDQRSHVGGVSVHTGTIPSKTLRETVLYLTGWRQRGIYGRSYKVKQHICAQDVMQRLDVTLKHQVEVMQHQLNRNGVDVIVGSAAFHNPHELHVQGAAGESTLYYGEHIVVACGTEPYRPSDIPFDGSSILDSDDILKISYLPRTLTIVGAGVIGVEYATIFSALDVEVTLIEGRDAILDFVDDEIIETFVHQMRDNGMILRFNERVSSIKKTSDGKVITALASGKRVRSDMVLYAAGRVGAAKHLKLENAGLEADVRGRLTVNAQYQTSINHIYAAGDIIGFPSLAATSMEQGRLAACHAFQHIAHSNTSFFPYGIYAVPEISMVGQTEQALKEAGIPYESGIARIRETARAQIMGLQDGLLKLLFAIDDRRLLGVHIVGEGATELIHIGQAVLSLGGKLDYFVESTFNYPTLAEAYKIAALNAWNKLAAYSATSVIDTNKSQENSIETGKRRLKTV